MVRVQWRAAGQLQAILVALCLLLLVLSTGCTGSIEGDSDAISVSDGSGDGTADSGTDARPDGNSDASPDLPGDAPRPDVPTDGVDVPPDVPGDAPDPCAGVNCGPGGTCQNGTCTCAAGYHLEGNTCVQDGPCDNVTCGANSRCEVGLCICVPGFVLDGMDCIAPPPGDPRARTQQEVCARWTSDYPTTASTIHSMPMGTCDPANINMTAHDDAMRRLNLFRWLVGLDPAGVDWTNQAKCQEAALMMDANNSLSHDPPSGWTCYTADGAQAAGSSNLALGYNSPAATVDGYMRDNNTPSLGHRRWCISPGLDDVGFGHHGRGGAMWSFGRTSGATTPEYIGYPGPGFFPIDAVLGAWSFSLTSGGFSNESVTITRISDNADVPSTVADAGSTYGFIQTLRIVPESSMISAGETYRVEVSSGGNNWSYETTLVNCP